MTTPNEIVHPEPGRYPPEAWRPAHRFVGKIAAPITRFLHIEAVSAGVLLLAAIVALVLANSSVGEAYAHFWHTEVTLGIGSATFRASLHFIINDVLMAVFFFVVGLEIRRELHEGELADPRQASLPAAAAVGGMLVPALIFVAFNPELPERQGWGIPMATDIAFAIGVLGLLGRRVSPALRVLLLAVAILDDIGGIVVIAVFYSDGFEPWGLAIAAAGLLQAFILQRLGARHPAAYVPFGVITWAGLLYAGVHPTMAGVLMGLLTPPRAWLSASVLAQAAADAQQADVRNDGQFRVALAHLAHVQREVLSPAERLQTALHPWVAFAVMPLFALANAGVELRLDASDLSGVAAGTFLGLVVGKPVGIVAGSFLAVRTGLSVRPRGVTWRGIFVVGLVAGIGFTVALFISGLALEDAALRSAKLATLAASLLAGVAAYVAGRLLLSARAEPGAAKTPEEAEASAER